MNGQEFSHNNCLIRNIKNYCSETSRKRHCQKLQQGSLNKYSAIYLSIFTNNLISELDFHNYSWNLFKLDQLEQSAILTMLLRCF